MENSTSSWRKQSSEEQHQPDGAHFMAKEQEDSGVTSSTCQERNSLSDSEGETKALKQHAGKVRTQVFPKGDSGLC